MRGPNASFGRSASARSKRPSAAGTASIRKRRGSGRLGCLRLRLSTAPRAASRYEPLLDPRGRPRDVGACPKQAFHHFEGVMYDWAVKRLQIMIEEDLDS